MDNVWELTEACINYVDNSNLFLSENGVWDLSLLDLMKKDLILYNQLTSGKADNILMNIRNYAKQRFKDETGNDLQTINIIPNPKFPYTFFSKINHSMVGQLIRCRGSVSSVNSIVIESTTYLTCKGCKTRTKVPNKRFKICPICDKPISQDNYSTELSSYRDILIQETYPDLSTPEVQNMRLIMPDNPDAQLIDYPDLFGNEHDILAVVKLEFIKTSECVAMNQTRLEIVGMKSISVKPFKQDYVNKLIKFRDSLGKDIIKKIASHIAINVFGNEAVKQALLLTTVGCHPISKDMPSKTTQMCTIMISDTAMGKSFMSKSFIPYVKRSKYITANTSGAGLLGGVEKKKSGEYVFSQGDLVMANNSFVILDEVDNMIPENREVLLTVISEGIIQVKKIKKFEQKIHTNFIIQGNPRTSHFDTRVGYFSQIDLTRPFLDRADFLIILKRPYNINDKNQSKSFHKYILEDHRENRELDDKLVKDYLHYVKHFVQNPTFTEEAKDTLVGKMGFLNEKYMNINKDDARPLSPRTLVSLQKISIAVSRLKLNKHVNPEDVEEAFQIYVGASVNSMIESFGTFDAFEIADVTTEHINRPKNSKELEQFIIFQCEQNRRNGIQFSELISVIVGKFGHSESLLSEILEKLTRNGIIMENPNGVFRLIE